MICFLLISSFSFSQSRVEMTVLEKARYDSTCVGEKTPFFSVVNSEQKEVNITEYEGANLVIDIWATWCAPCLKEAPYFHSLKEQYENDTLKFISISIDDFTEEWLSFIEQKGIEKQGQYFAGYNENHPVIWFITNVGVENGKEYKYTSVPRFLIIDKDQKIISRQASHPSTGELLKEIKNINK